MGSGHSQFDPENERLIKVTLIYDEDDMNKACFVRIPQSELLEAVLSVLKGYPNFGVFAAQFNPTKPFPFSKKIDIYTNISPPALTTATEEVPRLTEPLPTLEELLPEGFLKTNTFYRFDEWLKASEDVEDVDRSSPDSNDDLCSSSSVDDRIKQNITYQNFVLSLAHAIVNGEGRYAIVNDGTVQELEHVPSGHVVVVVQLNKSD